MPEILAFVITKGRHVDTFNRISAREPTRNARAVAGVRHETGEDAARALPTNMTRLGEIAVRMEVMAPRAAEPDRSGCLGGSVATILTELAARLERLAANGDSALVDLRSLSMSAADRSELQEALGQGEVTATLDAQGVSTLSETAFAGVWWTVYRDLDGAVSSELLEVSLVPPILVTNPEDVALAAAALRRRIDAAIAERN